MNISSINDLISSTTSTATSTNKLGSDKETFLKLLVAQMKNQDPTNPQDSVQYMSQLAQFSSLEQLTTINQQLGQLIDLSKK